MRRLGRPTATLLLPYEEGQEVSLGAIGQEPCTNKYSKQHFINLSKYEYDNEVALPENWDQLLHDTMAMGGDEIASSQQTISQEEDENTLDDSQIMV